MASDRARADSVRIAFVTRLPRTSLAVLLVPILLAAALAAARVGGLGQQPRDPGLVAGVGAATADELTDAAARALRTALAPGGGGVTFEVVQTSTILSRPGDPLLEIPDPDARTQEPSARSM
jgi:hypothetical protein